MDIREENKMTNSRKRELRMFQINKSQWSEKSSEMIQKSCGSYFDAG